MFTRQTHACLLLRPKTSTNRLRVALIAGESRTRRCISRQFNIDRAFIRGEVRAEFAERGSGERDFRAGAGFTVRFGHNAISGQRVFDLPTLYSERSPCSRQSVKNVRQNQL